MKFSIFFIFLATQILGVSSENPLYQALPTTLPLFESLQIHQSEGISFIPVDFRDSLEKNWVPTEDNFFQDQGIQIAQNRFEEFCLHQAQTNLIPKKIHLIWLGSPPPPQVQLAYESWERMHSDWEIKLWVEKDLEEFQWTSVHSKMVFEQGKNWAEKSDILRLEILYQFGGIYSDTDVICLKSFEDLVSKNGLTFFAGLESNQIKRFGRPLVGSAILGAKQHSSTIKQAIELTFTAEEAPTIHQHLRSGPGPITTACYHSLESNDLGILLLPCSYFYPLPWEKRLSSGDELKKSICKESLAVHLWEGSWFDYYYPPQLPKYKKP